MAARDVSRLEPVETGLALLPACCSGISSAKPYARPGSTSRRRWYRLRSGCSHATRRPAPARAEGAPVRTKHFERTGIGAEVADFDQRARNAGAPSRAPKPLNPFSFENCRKNSTFWARDNRCNS